VVARIAAVDEAPPVAQGQRHAWAPSLITITAARPHSAHAALVVVSGWSSLLLPRSASPCRWPQLEGLGEGGEAEKVVEVALEVAHVAHRQIITTTATATAAAAADMAGVQGPMLGTQQQDRRTYPNLAPSSKHVPGSENRRSEVFSEGRDNPS
jgi:hypothetical protein